MTHNNTHVKQLVILSGKGGTGKTCLSAALIDLTAASPTPAVFVDADVDAANLALLTNAKILETHPFSGSAIAELDPALCINCGKCFEVCRYDAVLPANETQPTYAIIDLLCDGCAACVYVCPETAIQMAPQQDGEWYHSITPYGHQFHAELLPAAENTGKLVTTVKQHAKLFAEDHQLPWMIIDGPPGIGCPVISASAGADLALLVAEPGVSGLHDLERIIQTLQHFKTPALVCINKSDIYPEGNRAIYALATSYDLPVIGEIPFDDAFPKSMVAAQPITRFAPHSPAVKVIQEIWDQVHQTLFQESREA